MASRYMVQSYWKRMLSGLPRGSATYATPTSPNVKASAPTADYAQPLYYHHDELGTGTSKSLKGDFVPVYVALGMIALSTGLGLYTGMHHLLRAPDVRVNKKRRETIPEVVEPDRVVEEAKRFITKSFFRKVAHVQELKNPVKQVMSDPIHKDAYAYPLRAETLKSVGIDPNQL